LSYPRREWVSEKIEIATCLHEGGCGGSYSEAIIVLSAAISSIAAEVWPGERIDRRRFVEAIKDCRNVKPESIRISIPLLIRDLCDSKKTEEAELLRAQFMDVQETLVSCPGNMLDISG